MLDNVCALASLLHVFCFHSEGGVKKSWTGEGLKSVRTGGYCFGGIFVGGQYPITCG